MTGIKVARVLSGVLLVALLGSAFGSRPVGAQTGSWASVGNMIAPRVGHTATQLSSGQVLIAGGDDCSAYLLNPCPAAYSAELYNPATQQFQSTGAMVQDRRYHTATPLTNGLVLVVGGVSPQNTVLAGAELYNPSTGAWSATASLHVARRYHTATLLPDGEVLVAGGRGATNAALTSAEIYNPATGVWTVTGSMITARYNHAAAVEQWNGQVLIAGGTGSQNGSLNSAEVYNPATHVWAPASHMASARSAFPLVTLPFGVLMAVGGCCTTPYGETFYGGAWSLTTAMATARSAETATFMPNNNNQLLVAGGENNMAVSTNTAELYNVVTGTWTGTASMKITRSSHTATLLSNGQVLVTGGADLNDLTQGSAEIYTP